MNAPKHLVIVGGGFAGATLAQALERQLPRGWHLTLVSQENFITYNPLLPEVVGASILPGHVIAPLRQMICCSRVAMAEVTSIDTHRRELQYGGEASGRILYDQLILACGANANLDIVEGMNQYALPLKTLGDALFLRNRLISRLEQAELQPDPLERRWLASFVIVGGGFSGVETAGELVDFLRSSLRYYPRVRREDLRIVLLHGTERLLPDLSPSLGEFARRKMLMYGVEVHLRARATSVTQRAVLLVDGTVIEAGTVICTIGTRSNPLLDQIPAPKQRGRLIVAPDMSVPGVDGVWALGDCAAVPNGYDGQTSPPTAQFATRQARVLACNIVAKLSGRATTLFRFKPLGQLSSIGHNKAVAEILGLKLSGFVAWLLWRGVYLLKIPTVSRKARLFLEWNWAMFFPPDISHLGFRRTRLPAARTVEPAGETASMPARAARG